MTDKEIERENEEIEKERARILINLLRYFGGNK